MKSNPAPVPSRPNNSPTRALPARAGVGFKPAHFNDVMDSAADLGFFEVHAENYLVSGGAFHHQLTSIRDRYPLSIHGVALSIGADEDLDFAHLEAIAALLDRYEPQSFSEHLAWSTHDGAFLNDLLPLPYTEPTLRRVCEHVDQIQTRLKRRILLENPATYVQFAESTIFEADFIADVIGRTGCGLLLDVNNAYVSSVNHHFDAREYLKALPLAHTGEIHLAGHAVQQDDAGAPLLIDNHGAPVSDPVWELYRFSLEMTGPVATLIERDTNLPAWPALAAEARLAEELLSPARLQRRTA